MSPARPRPRDPEDLFDMTAGELQAAYLAGRLSPSRAVADLLDRIDALEPTMNAFIRVTAELALAEAERAEAVLGAQGERALARMPLLGVPVTVKDNFDLAGHPTTAGTTVPWREGAAGDGEGRAGLSRAERDAAAVAALKAAGAVILGKTNLHELAFGATTENPHFGPSRNPWDTERTPGGSSGGAAAALGAGFGVLALGSDTGGSVRCPAALSGLFGLKPPGGFLSTDGMAPLAPSLDCPGLLARSADDLALGLAVLAAGAPAHAEAGRGAGAGPGAGLPSAAELAAAWGARPEAALRGQRVALVRGRPFWDGVTPDVERAVLRVADALSAAGAEVEETEAPDLARAGAAQAVIVTWEAARLYGRLAREAPPFLAGPELGEDVRHRLEEGLALAPEEVEDARRSLAAAREGVGRLLSGRAALLLPTTRGTADPLGFAFPGGAFDSRRAHAQRTRYLGNTGAANALGLAGLTVPAGLSIDGLPVGAQFLAPSDGLPFLLAVARSWEAVARPPRPEVESLAEGRGGPGG